MPDDATRREARPHDKYDRLIHAAKQLPTIAIAVAHPCDAVSLESAVEAAKRGLVRPILVGPAARVHLAVGAAPLRPPERNNSASDYDQRTAYEFRNSRERTEEGEVNDLPYDEKRGDVEAHDVPELQWGKIQERRVSEHQRGAEDK
jgi:hypothetical protein